MYIYKKKKTICHGNAQSTDFIAGGI